MKVDTVGEMEMEARRLVDAAGAACARIDAAEVARGTLTAFPQVPIEFHAVLEEYIRGYLDKYLAARQWSRLQEGGSK
jgi:hypothetical protein